MQVCKYSFDTMNTHFVAKLTVSQAEPNGFGGESITMDAIYTGTPEDNSFASATPSAQFKMTLNNLALLDRIKQGQKFKVMFEQVEE